MWSFIVRENAVDEEAFVLVHRQTQLKLNLIFEAGSVPLCICEHFSLINLILNKSNSRQNTSSSIFGECLICISYFVNMFHCAYAVKSSLHV